MKKSSKKALTLALCSLMVLSTACGSTSDKDGSSSSSKDETTAAAETEAETEAGKESESKNPQDKYEAIDMGGREFTFVYNWDMVPATSDVELDSATANAEQIGKLANMKRLEEKYNCKIKYVNVPYDQISEKLTTSVMAGQPFCDGINLQGDQIFSAIMGNQILPISQYAPKNADVLNDQKVLRPGTVLGEDYILVETNVPISGKYIAFNRDIIGKLGLETPDELYKKGEWNWDNFLKIAKAATQDTNGDGTIDQWGLAGTPGRLAPHFIAANGGYLLDDVNKKSGLDDAKTVEALDFMNKIYNVEKVGYLLNNDASDYNNDTTFNEGTSAMFYCENWMLPTADPKLSFDFGAAPFPTGPSNTEGTLFFDSDVGVCIPTGVEKPEWAYQVFEELIDWCGADFDSKTDGTTAWLESMWLTEEDVDTTIDISSKGGKMDYFNCIPEYPLGNVVTAFLNDGKTVAQAVEENKQIAQDKVDSTLKK